MSLFWETNAVVRIMMRNDPFVHRGDGFSCLDFRDKGRSHATDVAHCQVLEVYPPTLLSYPMTATNITSVTILEPLLLSCILSLFASSSSFNAEQSREQRYRGPYCACYFPF